MPKTIRDLALITGLSFCHSLFGAQSDYDGIAEAACLIRQDAANHRLILIGELHGTRQIPELVARLVSTYSEQGSVLLGLEVPSSEQEAIRLFLASDGGSEARSALQTAPFWHVNGVQHDGRRNYDALDLIERVRRLKAKGRNVDILPYDNPPTDVVDSEGRDKAMADRLRNAYVAMPRGRLLVVSGNVHAMLQRPSYAPAEMQTPMGSYLRDLDPFSIDTTARDGEFWACLKECGPIPVHPPSQTSQRIDDGTYNLRVVLPRLTIARLIGAPSEDH